MDERSWDRIPDHLVVELSGLEIGDSLHISRVVMPEGCRPTITDRDFTIATIAADPGNYVSSIDRRVSSK